MLQITPQMRILVAVEAVDFRKGIDSLAELCPDLGRAYREGRLDRRMRVYLAPKVLIIDEMGYLPLDEMGATIFFNW